MRVLVLFFIHLLVVFCESDDSARSCEPAQTYDYIVVGAGAAGAVIAKELSDKNNKVLLIEAGAYKDDDPNVRNPENALVVAQQPYYNFDYFSSKIPSIGNRRIECSVGKMWGGSSSHNLMLYVIGNDYDYDRWALYGGQEWSSYKLRPLFKQMENNSLSYVSDLETFKQFHGTMGRVSVRNAPPAFPDFYQKYLSAVHDVLGLDEIEDYNGATQEGVASLIQRTQQTLASEIVRESSSTAYLSQDIVRLTSFGDGVGVKRRKLWVHSNSFATKLIFDEKRVIGIKYIKNGEEITARVTRDVIVSAGALISPAFLMRNGIGNCTELTKLGIECVAYSKSIGRNLQDHPLLPIWVQTAGNISDTILAPYKSKVAHKFTDTAHTNGKVVVDTFLLQGVDALAPLLVSDQISSSWNKSLPVFLLASVLLRPKSMGSLRISTKDPLAAPLIEHCYLCHQDDFDWAYTTLHDMLKIVNKLHESDPSVNLVYPTPDSLTEQNINKTIRNIITSMFHHSGTVRLGEALDGNLCVKGVKGLRVADASIMPFVPSANTNAASMMIGRKAADLIKSTSCL